MHSLADFGAGKLRRWKASAAILALLGSGCRHSTPDSSQTARARPLFPVLVGAAWGFIDGGGKVVIPPRFEAVLPFSEDLAAAKHEDRWGYINRNGAEVIPFRCRRAVSEGLITVRGDGGKLGYMDLNGNLAIEPRYDQAGDFAEGLAAASLQGRWIFIDKSGVKMAQLPPEVVFAGPLSDGLSLVTAGAGPSDRKLGYVGRNGQWAIKPVWDDADPFHDGLAYVGAWKNGVSAYINPKGKRVWEGRSDRGAELRPWWLTR